jgi:hypothetical protein
MRYGDEHSCTKILEPGAIDGAQNETSGATHCKSAKTTIIKSASTRFQTYAVSLGELAFSSNSLHNHLANLFELVVKSLSQRMGVSTWYSSDSDYAQRKILRATVQGATRLD